MFEVVMSNQFKRDLKLIAKRGYNLELLNEVVNILADGGILPPRIMTTD